ncbi:hypothetical protein [Longimicrobium sp.]|uniref:hypothetical protein n=1 Tax=Longimicrobium sp. TaxID=2029185 RepID=UPI002E36C69D|nr:hypothetical protein [Longimicrobium sp.]HEX6037500.1 hypothetical protein [Longimicrobium sp.]
MMPWVMAETPFNADLLKQLLATLDLPEHGVLQGGRKTGAALRGNTVLHEWNEPVIVVLDSDSVEPENIWEQESTYRYLVPAGDFPGCPADVLMAVPQVEAVLFSDHDALACILGRELTEREKIEGEFRPRAVLDRLLADVGMDRDAFLRKIPPQAATRFAAHSIVQSIAAFVERANDALALADAA